MSRNRQKCQEWHETSEIHQICVIIHQLSTAALSQWVQPIRSLPNYQIITNSGYQLQMGCIKSKSKQHSNSIKVKKSMTTPQSMQAGEQKYDISEQKSKSSKYYRQQQIIKIVAYKGETDPANEMLNQRPNSFRQAPAISGNQPFQVEQKAAKSELQQLNKQEKELQAKKDKDPKNLVIVVR